MKEIKFRAWDRQKNRFVVCNVHIDGTGLLFWQFGYNEEIVDDKENYIIQQYTGLKDKNGKEIYEGDIIKEILSDELLKVKPKYYQSEMIYVCGVGNGAFGDCINGFVFNPIIEDAERKFVHHIRDDCEIIGNIYENPELLKNIKMEE